MEDPTQVKFIAQADEEENKEHFQEFCSARFTTAKTAMLVKLTKSLPMFRVFWDETKPYSFFSFPHYYPTAAEEVYSVEDPQERFLILILSNDLARGRGTKHFLESLTNALNNIHKIVDSLTTPDSRQQFVCSNYRALHSIIDNAVQGKNFRLLEELDNFMPT